MKVKKIFISKYDGPWIESDLDYEAEVTPIRRILMSKNKNTPPAQIDRLYLAMRSATAGINSYTIMEVEIPNPEICIQKYKLTDYEMWKSCIHEAVNHFNNKYDQFPHLLIANSASLKRLQEKIANEIKTDDPEHYELTHFSCPEFDIHFCIDTNVKDDRIHLIHSKDALIIQKWRKLFEINPEIDATTEFGEMNTSDIFHPWIAAPVIDKFVQKFYALDLAIDFDWKSWTEGPELLQEKRKIQEEDLTTLQKLLTLIIRQDRFADGTLVSAFQDGLIQNILKVAKEKSLEFLIKKE